MYHALARSNTLRSTHSEHSSQAGVVSGHPNGSSNGAQSLMGVPGISVKKHGSSKNGTTANTIRKIFGSAASRKVRDYGG